MGYLLEGIGKQRLARLIGLSGVKELCLTGGTIEAAQALALGISNSVCSEEELLSQAAALVKRVAS